MTISTYHALLSTPKWINRAYPSPRWASETQFSSQSPNFQGHPLDYRYTPYIEHRHQSSLLLFFCPPLCISCLAIITGQPLKIEPWINQRPECFLYAGLYPDLALCSARKAFECRSSWQSRDSSQQTRRGMTERRETGFVFEVNRSSSVEAGC